MTVQWRTHTMAGACSECGQPIETGLVRWLDTPAGLISDGDEYLCPACADEAGDDPDELLDLLDLDEEFDR